MDESADWGRRLGALDPHQIRIWRAMSPARRLEIEHAKEEGIRFEFLVQPVAFAGDEAGYVRKLRCLRCELGEPDASGRRRPVAIQGSEFDADCDVAVANTPA